MKPLIHEEVETNFRVLSEQEIARWSLVEELTQKTALVLPYNNYAMEFYEILYGFQYEDKEWVVFGQDLGG